MGVASQPTMVTKAAVRWHFALGVAGSTSATDPFTSAPGWIAIGYLGMGDALKSGLTVGNWLTENGVAESNGAIETGQYLLLGLRKLLWSLEHRRVICGHGGR